MKWIPENHRFDLELYDSFPSVIRKTLRECKSNVPSILVNSFLNMTNNIKSVIDMIKSADIELVKHFDKRE